MKQLGLPLGASVLGASKVEGRRSMVSDSEPASTSDPASASDSVLLSDSASASESDSASGSDLASASALVSNAKGGSVDETPTWPRGVPTLPRDPFPDVSVPILPAAKDAQMEKPPRLAPVPKSIEEPPARPPQPTPPPSETVDGEPSTVDQPPASTETTLADRLRSLAPLPKEPREALLRRIPWKAKLVLAAGGAALGLLLLAKASPEGTAPKAAISAPSESAFDVSEEDLSNFRQVRPDDFTPKEKYLKVKPRGPAPSSAGGAPVSKSEAAELEARRARREDDPEDLIQKRQGRGGRSARQNGGVAASDTEAPLYLEPVRQGNEDAMEGRPGSKHKGADGRVILQAGDVVPARLVAPLELQGRSATVVAAVSERPLEGARFIGTASPAGDRVAMRFRTLVLPGGEELRVSAEGHDEDGQTGVIADVSGGAEPEEPSVGKEVARNTATDVALDVLGGGIVGRATGSYLRESERRANRGAPGSRRTWRLEEGSVIGVLLERAVRTDLQ